MNEIMNSVNNAIMNNFEKTGLIVIQDSIPAILDKCKS